MPQQAAMDRGLEDIAREQYNQMNPNQLEGKLEKVVSDEELDKKSSWLKIGWDIIKYSPVLAAQFAFLGPVATLSTGIISAGLSIGGYFDAKKQKKKYTWNRLKREAYSGNLLGFVDYAVFSMPEMLIGAYPGIFGVKALWSYVLKASMFNPLMVPAYNFIYNSFTYFRDYVGWGKSFKGLFTGKIFRYMKECWDNKHRKDTWQDSVNAVKYMWPLHFTQINFLPNAQLRMLQSALINGPVYRYIMGRSERAKNINNLKPNR